jgi:hypothetical protein
MKLSAERTAEIVAGSALLGMAGFTAWTVIVGVRQEALTVGELLDQWGLFLFLILLVGGAIAFGIRLVMPKPQGKPALNRAAYVLLAYAWVVLAAFGIFSGAASLTSFGLNVGSNRRRRSFGLPMDRSQAPRRITSASS